MLADHKCFWDEGFVVIIVVVDDDDYPHTTFLQ